MNAAAARATQDALDDALAPLTLPVPLVLESNTEFAWLMYRIAEQQLQEAINANA